MEEDIPEPSYLDTPNGRIAWWVARGGSGTPAVIVHGGPGDGCNPLKGPKMDLGRDVFQYDQLGCGMSDPMENPELWTAEDYADELELFLDKVVKGKAVLIGASWGAGLIVTYIGKYGTGRIAGLVLPSPFLSTQDWLQDMEDNLKDMSEGHYLRLMEHHAGTLPEDNFMELRTEYRQRYLFARKENAPLAVPIEEDNPVFEGMWGPDNTECIGTLKDFDVTDTLPTIDVPVLFMCGDSDEIRIRTMLDYVD